MSADQSAPQHPDEPERVVIRDNRKIDPVTGEARKGSPATEAETASGAADPAVEPDQEPMVEAALLEERTRDLQRLQAEYANYRKRAERERLTAGELAIGRTLAELLPVVDDLDRAKAHGDLTGALKAVADKLDATFTKLGLVAFGEVGDPFDPSIHEAVLHDESDAVTVATCTTVMRQGYQHHDRLLRPALVGVTDPVNPTAAPLTISEQSKGTADDDPSEPTAPPHDDAAGASSEPSDPATKDE